MVADLMTTGTDRRGGAAADIDEQDAVSHDHLLDGQIGKGKDERRKAQGLKLQS